MGEAVLLEKWRMGFKPIPIFVSVTRKLVAPIRLLTNDIKIELKFISPSYKSLLFANSSLILSRGQAYSSLVVDIMYAVMSIIILGITATFISKINSAKCTITQSFRAYSTSN